MTSSEYRSLRNYLQGIACTIDVNTIEYKNLNKRIKIIHSKI